MFATKCFRPQTIEELQRTERQQQGLWSCKSRTKRSHGQWRVGGVVEGFGVLRVRAGQDSGFRLSLRFEGSGRWTSA